MLIKNLAAALAEKDGNGYAPDSLPRDAPVGPRGDHVGNTVLAPRRVPFHLPDLLQGAAAQGALGLAQGILDLRFHRDEPLFRRTKDDGIMTAPAVRIGVFDPLVMQ